MHIVYVTRYVCIQTQALELCASLVTRADEVAAFCETLRPGPLEAIVRKQVRRLEAAVQLLHAPASAARRNSFLGLQAACVMKKMLMQASDPA